MYHWATHKYLSAIGLFGAGVHHSWTNMHDLAKSGNLIFYQLFASHVKYNKTQQTFLHHLSWAWRGGYRSWKNGRKKWKNGMAECHKNRNWTLLHLILSSTRQRRFVCMQVFIPSMHGPKWTSFSNVLYRYCINVILSLSLSCSVSANPFFREKTEDRAGSLHPLRGLMMCVRPVRIPRLALLHRAFRSRIWIKMKRTGGGGLEGGGGHGHESAMKCEFRDKCDKGKFGKIIRLQR